MVSKNREASAGRSANRLIEESSPYLLQHAHNPVDWYPWGTEALDRAAAEDRPILLSIGYSACHWCHVMESESFENESIAQLMNNNFICIKVDREERPDIDEIYMKAVQLMTGHGGWPMTVFLTPDLKPFFGGTYFPPEDRHGMPGFRRVLASVMSAWQSSREQIETSADELKAFLGKFESIAKEDVVLDRRFIDMAVEHLLRTADHQFGGFGNAPKFPFPASLELAMRIAGRQKGDAAADCRRLVVNTLERMAMGGIHDQIGGGFARYSVDRQWLVPHFEKMLYDNATMSKLYFDAYRLTGRQYFRQVGLSCLAFVRRELQAEGGAFYSSLDADSEGEEGKFYVFTPDEIKAALGAEDGAWLCQVYGVHAGGNFEQGRSVLHLTDSPEELAARQGLSLDQFDARLAGLSARLLESRESRTRPGRDEKVITSWNGLMISGFVAGYKVTGDQSLLSAARAAASFMLDTMVAGDRLLRTFGQGRARLNAYLDDYAHLIQALLDLAEVDTDPRWYGRALELAQSMIERFWDSDSESFFYVSHDHERLLARPRNFYDGSTPSGTSTAARDLLRLARLSGDTRMAGLADKVISLFAPHFHKSPDQFANLICALDFSLAEPVEIAIVADDRDDSWIELMLSAHRHYLPNVVTLVTSAKSPIASPLFTGRGLADGRTAAYVCRSFTCAQPATSSEELLTSLSSG